MADIQIGVETLQWTAYRTENGRWVAECEAFGLATEADTLDELYISLIPEVLSSLFDDLLEEGDFERFLLDRGWNAEPLKDVSADDGFPIPWDLAVPHGAASGPERRAH